MGIEKRRSTLCVLFYIKRQKLLKNGEAPVCMRITVDKRKAEIVIKRSVPVELWNQSKECSKGKDRSSQELNEERITDRNVAFEMHCGLNLVNAMVHGRDKKVGSYALFPALLFENRQIKVRQEAVINIIEEAIRNDYNICLMKVNRHTNEVVGEGEMVLIPE